MRSAADILAAGLVLFGGFFALVLVLVLCALPAIADAGKVVSALRELATELWHILTDRFRRPTDNEDTTHA